MTDFWNSLQFPYAFWLLLVWPILLFFHLRQKRELAIRYSSLARIQKLARSSGSFLRHFQFFLKTLALIALVVALARPRSGSEDVFERMEGVDISLVMDFSGSMQLTDMIEKSDEKGLKKLSARKYFDNWYKEPYAQYTRMGVAKEVIADFVRHRKGDRLSLTGFASEARILSPSSTDPELLIHFLEKATPLDFGNSQTAIGDGMMTALTRLKDSDANSKVMILLTDGSNNDGYESPEIAGETAQSLGVKVYTIALLGTGTKMLLPTSSFSGVYWDYQEIPRDTLNEGILKKISESTGGKYFTARDKKSLESVYQAIDKMEKTKLSSIKYVRYKEHYFWWLLIGVALILLELILFRTIWMRIP